MTRVGKKSEEAAGQIQILETAVGNLQDEFARGAAEIGSGEVSGAGYDFRRHGGCGDRRGRRGRFLRRRTLLGKGRAGQKDKKEQDDQARGPENKHEHLRTAGVLGFLTQA